jgi:hypothetical protein
MTEQNFKNHGRYIPLWHFITPVLITALNIGSGRNLYFTEESNRYSAALILVMSLVLWIFYWYARAFALKAQDRAIRAEENFRHFILTGKPLDGRLRMGQIIGLRFASDREFPELAQKAIADNLSQKQIKQAITNWKADYYRV